MSANEVTGEPKKASMKTVVVASAAGTAFEWYDFFAFGLLTAEIGRNFFTNLGETSSVLATLALFAAAYFFRPFGAIVFGRLGDVVGRKGAFLITVSMMGIATFAIGLLPTYQWAENHLGNGAIAAVLLIVMRILQGMAIGGEYGGAAIYVAEHAPNNKRGWHTGWIQTSAALGLVGALVVILICRTLFGPEDFDAWGWRIPFLGSAILLAISVYMRLKLSESPAFQAMKEAGEHSQSPYKDAFGNWPNLKIVLIALWAIMSAQGAAWYTAFFYTQVFLKQLVKVDAATVDALILVVTVASAPMYVFFAWLSDRIGRKWIMWFGMTLAVVAFFPAFHQMAKFGNPDLVAAQQNTPVVVQADPEDCSFQFDLFGIAEYRTSCDVATRVLTDAGVSYTRADGPAGELAQVLVDGQSVTAFDGEVLDDEAYAAQRAVFASEVRAELDAAGYPTVADPDEVNIAGLLAMLMIFTLAATALYGPMAAALVEMFPTKVRYTALSLPYHIGAGWIGGFVPVTALALVTASGNIYAGLWYPVIFTGISVVLCVFLIRDRTGIPLDEVKA